jgi:hypothetical protein
MIKQINFSVDDAFHQKLFRVKKDLSVRGYLVKKVENDLALEEGQNQEVVEGKE